MCPPAIVICRCKFTEHKFRSLTITEWPSASPGSSEISSWIALLRYTCLSLIPQGNFIVETWVTCPQIKTKREKKKRITGTKQQQELSSQSQEKLGVAAQIQSRNRCIATSGSYLKLLLQVPTNWQLGHRKTKGREPTVGKPTLPSFVVSVARLPCLLLCLSLSDSSRSFLSSKGSKVQVDSLDLNSVHHGQKEIPLY